MLRIVQKTFQKADVKERLEREIHSQADEFYPAAEGKTYMDLTGDEDCLYMIITIPRTRKAKTTDNEIIDRPSKKNTFSIINKVLQRISDMTIVSGCYCEKLEPNLKREACIFQFVALKNFEGLLPDALIEDVIRDMSAELGLDPEGDKPLKKEAVISEEVAQAEQETESQEETPEDVTPGYKKEEKRAKSKKKPRPKRNKKELSEAAPKKDKKQERKPAEIEPEDDIDPVDKYLDEIISKYEEELEESHEALKPRVSGWKNPYRNEETKSNSDEKDSSSDPFDFLGTFMSDFDSYFESDFDSDLNTDTEESNNPEPDAYSFNEDIKDSEDNSEDNIESDFWASLTDESEEEELPDFEMLAIDFSESNAADESEITIAESEEVSKGVVEEALSQEETTLEEMTPLIEESSTEEALKEEPVEPMSAVKSPDLNSDDDLDSDIPMLNRIDHYEPKIDLENRELFYHIEDKFETTVTTLSKEKLREYFQKTIAFFTTSKRTRFFMAQRGEVSRDLFLDEIYEYVQKYLKVPMEDEALFMNEVNNAIFGYYKLTNALSDPDVSDVKVLSPDKINVKVKGKHYTLAGTRFLNKNDYMVFIEGLLERNHAKSKSPIILFTDTKFHPDYALRFNLTLESLNTSEFPVLHVRKVAKNKMFVEDLVKADMMPQKVADYLKEKVKTSSIVFAGPPASGKTTCLNAYIEEIPYTEAALCIQESDELFAERHPNLMVQHILRDVKDRNGNLAYGLDEIGTNGLVCDVNYFVIGEIKGAEARTFLRASNTGNHVICTIHSPSATETIPRFADYIKYGASYTMQEAQRMLKDLEVIVYIEHFKIREIAEIVGYDDDKQRMIYRTVYKYTEEEKQQGVA